MNRRELLRSLIGAPLACVSARSGVAEACSRAVDSEYLVRVICLHPMPPAFGLCHYEPDGSPRVRKWYMDLSRQLVSKYPVQGYFLVGARNEDGAPLYMPERYRHIHSKTGFAFRQFPPLT